MQADYGKILMLNGTSSAGKTTLAKALQPALGEPFCYYASDQLADAGFRSRREYITSPSERQRFFDGFHRSIAAFASAGNSLIVEHIVEEQSWADDLSALLQPFNVFWVGVHAPVEELLRRESLRNDRTQGEALFHLKTHDYVRYDLEISSAEALAWNVARIAQAWSQRSGV